MRLRTAIGWAAAVVIAACGVLLGGQTPSADSPTVAKPLRAESPAPTGMVAQ